MRSLVPVVFLASFAPLGCAVAAQEESGVRLFNGKDFTGLTRWLRGTGHEDPDRVFRVTDGVLHFTGQHPGYVATNRAYENYRLVVEYRWPGEPGNCGVLVHASEPRRLYSMFPQSIECQMHVGNAGDFWCIGEDIKVPDMEARRGPPEEWGVDGRKQRRIHNLTDDSENPAGEWNQMVIECRGDTIDIWVNGDHVNQGFDCTASKGQIALQAEGAVCEFRKVELTPLGN